MKRRHEELINRLIDGELSMEERFALDEVLASSPAARAFHEKMILLQRAGESRVDVAPPQALKARVMDRIWQGSRRPVRTVQPWREFLHAWQRVLTPRVACGLAAGIIIGFGIGATTFTRGVGGSSSSSTLDFSGTMGVPPASGEFSQIDSDSFRGQVLSVKWTARRLADLVAIRIHLDAREAAALTLAHDPEAVVCQGIERISEDGAPVTIESGAVAITEVREGEFLLLMKIVGPASQTIGMAVASRHETYRHVISIQN